MRNATKRRFVATFFACALVGCNEASSRKGDQSSDVVHTRDAAQGDWLGASDRIDPAIWMIEKEAGHKISASDPRIDAVRQALHSAGERFLESDRMLVNRTVQLGQMLASDGRPERYVTLLVSLTDIITDTSNGKQTYGDLCQFYLNLRRAGVERGPALAKLKERVNLKHLQ